MSWKGVVVLCVLVGGGFAVQQNWDTISEELGLAELSPEHVRALELAKAAYTLDNARTNYAVIDARVAQSGAVIEAEGWKAERRSERLFLVTFRFTEDGREDGYWFQVDVGSTDVSNVRDDPKLVTLYGIPAAPPR